MNTSDTSAMVALLVGKFGLSKLIMSRKELDVLPENEEIARIVEAVNLAAQELSEDFFPLLLEETKTSNGQCEVAFSGFSKPVHMIFDVFDADGRKTTFRVFDTFAKMPFPNASYTFRYSHLPAAAVEKQDIETAREVTKSMLAFGACAHYCAWNQLFDEAKLWNDRFLNAISAVKKSLRKATRACVKKTWKI